MRARSIAGAVLPLLLVAAALVAPEVAHGVVTRAEQPAQAAAELGAVSDATRAAARQGHVLRTQEGVRTWTQLFDPVRRTMLTSTDDGRTVLDTPDAEFTPLDRAATTRTIVSEVGKARAAWSYVYDPGNPSYSPALATVLGSRFVGDGAPSAGSAGSAIVIDAATLTTRPDGLRVWSLDTHTGAQSAATTRITLAADAQDRLVWETVGAQQRSVSVSYEAPTVAHPTSPQVIWTTLLAHARERYASRTGISVASLAAAGTDRTLPRTPSLGDVGGSLPSSTPAVTTSTSKIHWAATGRGVLLRDVDLVTHQGDSLIERILVHRVRPVLRT